MDKQYKSFKQFYPYYLSEHMNPICRGLHFIGTLCVIGIIIISFDNIKALFIAPVCGYGFAWVGHFFFEKNRPATFKYPLYSFCYERIDYILIIVFANYFVGKKK